MFDRPTYYAGEVLDLIRVIEDLPTMDLLKELMIEEYDRYTIIDQQNMGNAWKVKYDAIKRRSLNQGM